MGVVYGAEDLKLGRNGAGFPDGDGQALPPGKRNHAARVDLPIRTP